MNCTKLFIKLFQMNCRNIIYLFEKNEFFILFDKLKRMKLKRLCWAQREQRCRCCFESWRVDSLCPAHVLFNGILHIITRFIMPTCNSLNLKKNHNNIHKFIVFLCKFVWIYSFENFSSSYRLKIPMKKMANNQ
jgi:hypothetical protein